MKSSITRGTSKLPSYSKLFLFTKQDEVRMITAIASARRFMRTYGKGRQPGNLVSDYNNYK